MDCDYVLVCNVSREEKQFKFHAATPEDAVEQAQKIVSHEQGEEVDRFPFSPIIVKAVLFRGFQEFEGRVKRASAV